MEQVMEYAAGTVYCPYWSARERSCCLGNDGLRLPVATHIDLYCRGKDFSSCPYYTEEFTEIRQQELSAAQIDRRRYRRIPGRMPVDLYRSADRGSGCVPGDTVSTVDFSYGGICFESTHPVPEATEVFFVLHGDSCSSSRPGTGHVKWCLPADSPSSVYHFGVFFAESSPAVAAVRKQFDLLAG